MPKQIAILIGIIACVASLGTADVGNVSLTSVTTAEQGTWQNVDLTAVATTNGASTPVSSDAIWMYAAMRFPTTGFTTYVWDSALPFRTGTTNVFDHTFSLTLPNPGLWTVYAWVSYGWPTTTTNYDTVVTAHTSSGMIPTLSLPALAVLGALLAGIGVFIIRRVA